MRILHFLVLFLGATVSYAADSSTVIFAPVCGVPQDFQNQTFETTADLQRCYAFVPCVGITSATQMAVRLGTTTITGGQTPTLGVAIYGTDTNYIVKGTNSYTDADESTIRTLTLTYPSGSNFNLVAGTQYYLCFCNSVANASGPGSYFAAGATATSADTYYNAFATRMGTVAGGCSSGTPNNTLGSITIQTSATPPIVEIGDASP